MSDLARTILQEHGRVGVRMQLDEVLRVCDDLGLKTCDVKVSGMLSVSQHEFELSPPVRPDAEAERLRGRMLDLDPYEPINREDTP